MLIWLHPGGAAGERVGVPSGIVRATEVEQVASVEFSLGAADARQALVLHEAHLQAQAIIEAAQQQAEALRAQAQAEREQAVRDGYQEGMSQAVVDWHTQQQAQQDQREESIRASQDKLAEIVTAAVERIVDSGPREALYHRALRNVQALTREATRVVLRVSPADHAHASAALADQLTGDASGSKVELRVDSSFQPGSCVFESEVGILDASLETQLQGLRTAMQRAVHRALSEEEPA